jgi:hypothetical protein
MNAPTWLDETRPEEEDLKLPRGRGYYRHMRLVVLILLLCDLALPMAPGAFQPLEPGQSVEAARRLSVQVAAAVPVPTPQPRFHSTPQYAPRISMAHAARRESTSRPFAVPLVRSPQVEAEASSTSEDPA